MIPGGKTHRSLYGFPQSSPGELWKLPVHGVGVTLVRAQMCVERQAGMCLFGDCEISSPVYVCFCIIIRLAFVFGSLTINRGFEFIDSFYHVCASGKVGVSQSSRNYAVLTALGCFTAGFLRLLLYQRN